MGTELSIPEEFKGLDVGMLAQDMLRTWISGDTAITLNPVDNDREGWDYFLEFPFVTPQAGKPWDTASPRIQCFVQVKGTDGDLRSRNVKLDNWQKFVSAPQPAFFLIFEFDGNSLQQAFLVHVHEKWMEKVLQRLRQTRTSESPPLHKQHVTLSWSDEDRIGLLSGEGLMVAILSHVGPDFDEYVQAKQKLRRELGLDAPYILQVTSKPYDSLAEMYREQVDFAIGQRKLPVGQMILRQDVRFGIAAETTDLGPGELAVKPEGHPVKVIFRNRTGTKRVTFPGTVYRPQDFFGEQPIPEEYLKYRIEYALGEIHLLPHTPSLSQTTLSVETISTPASIVELLNRWRIVPLIDDTASDPVEVLVEVGGKIVRLGKIEAAHLPAPVRLIAESVENAWFLVRQLDLPVDMIVTLERIVEQSEHLAILRGLLDANNPPIESLSGALVEIEGDLSSEFAMVVAREVWLGDYHILVTIGMGGPLRMTTDKGDYEILTPRRAHVEHFLLNNEVNAVRDALLSVNASLERKGYSVIVDQSLLDEQLDNQEDGITG